MPRRQYVADLQQTSAGVLPHGVHGVQPSEDDGQFEFLFDISDSGNAMESVKVTALIPELSEYPKSHEYMIFVGEDAPANVSNAIQNIRRTSGKTVFELLDIVSTTLSSLSALNEGETQMFDSQDDDDDLIEDDEDGDDIYDSDHEAFQTERYTSMIAPDRTSGETRINPADRDFRDRLHSDLMKARTAGFKVGILGGLLERLNAFLTLSIRMDKLGISDEAMQAWQVEPTDYLILIIQYPNGYKPNEELQSIESFRLAASLGMRVCMGKRPKPTLQEAIKAFSIAKREGKDGTGMSNLPGSEVDIDPSAIKETFISKSLKQLLEERLVPIIRFRGEGLGWHGAENMYQDQANAGSNGHNRIPDAYFEPEEFNTALPQIVNADHHCDSDKLSLSFPLLAMQFLLRHFVRCTEFCLVCHCKMNNNLEAIKPYVCDSELCLYQYITLGFGTSIEHEILAQPYVVDLLISFCYNSATARRLTDFPDGLSLMVPPISPDSAQMATTQTYEVQFDGEKSELLFIDATIVCPIRRGDWVVVKQVAHDESTELHCRVDDATYFPTISLGNPVAVSLPQTHHDTARLQQSVSKTGGALSNSKTVPPKTVTPVQSPKWVSGEMQTYKTDFKLLRQDLKCMTICKLLDTLPTVTMMRDWLVKRRPTELRHWLERISPAALSLLRWIIASNRACIMQVDGDQADATKSQQERLFGMKDYMQFRFAMGAPDKEQRFLDAVRETSARLSLHYPTMFAWHGSPLQNWHMIIREGLHYKSVAHGRAYGDGVYHAREAQISTGYAGGHHLNHPSPGASYGNWPNSVINIRSALALNEIVNAPGEFQSASPYYVVKQLDWIQTRYLFVQCEPVADSVQIGTEQKPQRAFAQDPARIPIGSQREPIIIPASAIKARRDSGKTKRGSSFLHNISPLKKLKLDHSVFNEGDNYYDLTSDVSDDDEFDAVFAEKQVPEPKSTSQVALKPKAPTTDFVAGSLDISQLPLMPEPEYAAFSTTVSLTKQLKSLHQIQSVTPLAELGWYIDTEKTDNLYQWIVELHSFHTFEVKGKKLPLVGDMQNKGITSIVLEVRFNKDFPFTPPYVRVIRPRFKTIAQGGGGHVVAGGAMCMELLTNTGWSSVSSMESVLMQVRLAIASEPFARLDLRTSGDYGVGEAADGYIRACQGHGWQIPPGFKEMAYGMPLQQ